MDNNDLKERDFEAYIEHWLTTEGGYTKLFAAAAAIIRSGRRKPNFMAM